MKSEVHLFIIWEKARYIEKEILEDIKKTFKIINVYDVKWSSKKFSENLSRFYGVYLPDNSAKEEHCGNGNFLLVIVEDNNPKYENRQTSRGEEYVNVNMFDKKTLYREMTGGGHKVHATNNEIETNHDLTLLLDKNIEDYVIENDTWNGEIQTLNKDLFGAYKWNNTTDMFYALNNCTKYAILRNYEELPEEIYVNEHNDVDIICESNDEVAYILNAKPVFEEKYRVHYNTMVENRKVFFDLRYINDNYYYNKMEERILNNRIYNEKGFYTLNIEDYFYTLLYHALIQKLDFRDDYKKRLIKLDPKKRVNKNTSLEEFANILNEWMKKNNYILVKPRDRSVIFNIHMARLLTPPVYEESTDEQIDIIMATYNGGKYIAKQIQSILEQTYSNFRLIISDDASTDNTAVILKEFEKKDNRIEVYYQNENKGTTKNFEFLLQKVENNLFALSDQDDIWLPNKIEKSIENMNNNQSDLVFSDLILIDENDEQIDESYWDKKGLRGKIKKDKQCKGLLLNNYVTGCTILTKKRFLKDIMPLPENSKYIIHDYWIAIVVSQKGKISYLEKPYIKYRQHSNNQVGAKTRSKELNNIDEIRKLFIDVKIDHYKTFLENKKVFNEEVNQNNQNYLSYFEMLKNVKRINFKRWGTFYKLYHYENFKYYVANFVILNIPIIAKMLYKRR